MKGYPATPDDRLRRHVSRRRLCDFTLDFTALEARFGIGCRHYFSAALPTLQRMERDGLIRFGAHRLNVLPAGRLLVRSVAMRFDRPLAEQSERRFSRVI
ncbi:MAG: hypothetical protein ACOY41_12300 [Pseudomonadota bacterium]